MTMIREIKSQFYTLPNTYEGYHSNAEYWYAVWQERKKLSEVAFAKYNFYRGMADEFGTIRKQNGEDNNAI